MRDTSQYAAVLATWFKDCAERERLFEFPEFQHRNRRNSLSCSLQSSGQETGLRVWLLPYQPNVVASRVSLDFPEDCARDLFGIPYWFDPFRTRPRDEDKWIPFGLDINFQWSRCIQMSCVCGYANFATNLPRDWWCIISVMKQLSNGSPTYCLATRFGGPGDIYHSTSLNMP